MVERWESVVCMLTCFQCILSDVHSTTATRNSLTALRRLSSPVSYMRPAAHFVRRVHAAAPTRTRCATRQAGTRRREEHSQRRASHNLCSILHRTRCRAGDGCAQNVGKSKPVPTHGEKNKSAQCFRAGVHKISTLSPLSRPALCTPDWCSDATGPRTGPRLAAQILELNKLYCSRALFSPMTGRRSGFGPKVSSKRSTFER